MNSCQVKKFISILFLLFLVLPVFSFAQERGIGVSPAKIEIEQSVDWPYTVPITVTNFSVQEEQFEVFFEKESAVVASAMPGRFSLGGGASRRVLVTFEEPWASAEGFVKVLSTKTSPEGFTTGTGINIPFSIESSNTEKFLAAANQATPMFPMLFGIGLIIATIILLWYLSGIIKPWILNSNKQ